MNRPRFDMCAVVALLGLMLFMWGAAIWATFSEESEESDQPEEESQTHSNSELRRDVA